MHLTTARVSPTAPAPFGGPPPAEPPRVLVETLLLRHHPVDGFAFRRLLTGLDHGALPDDAARRLCLLDEDDDRHVVHSTSWRATDEGQIILTYVVHPDPDPSQESLAVPCPHEVARAPRPGHPAPPDLALHHVAAHAIRHLAFLGRTDPAISAHLACWPDARRALGTLPGLTAGQL